jgi:hypothetical protein
VTGNKKDTVGDKEGCTMNLKEAGRGVLWFAIGVAVVAVAIFLLQQQMALRRDSVIIRSYPVAPEIAGEMRSALADALATSSRDGAPLGRVSLTADGRLLVVAPRSVQGGVESLLADVAANKPAPTPTIRFEIWLVSAKPRTTTTTDNSPGLVEIGPALANIQRSQGPLQFELTEKLTLQARAGNEDSEIQGAHFGMRVTPTVRHDTKGDPMIAARVNVQMITGQFGPQFGPYSIPPTLKALVEIRPGEMMVIGQSSLRGEAGANATSGTPDTQAYYVVRASL